MSYDIVDVIEATKVEFELSNGVYCKDGNYNSHNGHSSVWNVLTHIRDNNLKHGVKIDVLKILKEQYPYVKGAKGWRQSPFYTTTGRERTNVTKATTRTLIWYAFKVLLDDKKEKQLVNIRKENKKLEFVKGEVGDKIHFSGEVTFIGYDFSTIAVLTDKGTHVSFFRPNVYGQGQIPHEVMQKGQRIQGTAKIKGFYHSKKTNKKVTNLNYFRYHTEDEYKRVLRAEKLERLGL